MAELLCSVGLDVGTTTTQLVVSELTVENQASAFSVPRMAITGRKILYKSPIHFTPLLGGELVDGEGIRQIVLREYEAAGIQREQVDTGAVIITGETSRKENAQAVLASLSDFAGDFVVATAGPDLESVLAAKGAGAVERSENATVLHMDIGGGTSNLALVQEGKILQTGCMNVGGRLVKIQDGRISYVSPVLEGLTDLSVGDAAEEGPLKALAQTLAQALEMAAGFRPPTAMLEGLWTKEASRMVLPEATPLMVSFSGGVADCIENVHPLTAFGDLGPALGQAIRRSRLCQGAYALGKETIRATVIGAGCHSAQLSGSTVFYRNVDFPLKNLPVVTLGETRDTDTVVALDGPVALDYARVTALAEEILRALPTGAVYLAMEQDAAKALGQALALRMEPTRPLLCLDRLQLSHGDYLDVAAPIGPALPVVIKTLVFSQ